MPVKRIILGLLMVVLSVGFALSTVTVTEAAPSHAEAPVSVTHNYDGQSLTTCYAVHTAGWNLILHSHPVILDPAYVDYGCEETDGIRCRHYFATRWWNSVVTRHDDSPIVIC